LTLIGLWSAALRRVLQVVLALLLLLAADIIVVGLLLPDWSDLKEGKVPVSAYIEEYKDEREDDPKLPPLRFTPVSFNRISPNFLRAVIASEDGMFYQHHGIDWFEVRAAIDRAITRQKFRGASTITSQVARNLYLSSDRSIIRKWHELLLTWFLEERLPKTRILNLYCNIAEFGVGIYGVEAAAQYYYGVSASQLSSAQAAALVASLPSPKKHNPRTNTRTFRYRERRVRGLMAR
jgi:monofunctional glycosyltransferase